ncbi:cell wall hydrolase [Bacillus sp. SA1-12]|uniref:N-acetylmuramoyl-L-alanine amidase n=1 Tax=Bacillus sp. SA1-12 TaxID=1455638 RepID=UPI000625F5BD|nr:N-acetylmuramoyl-L-alanine amidase [Bacillus sp. SA1-12]KKI92829.1 cell wall hydrolase [Bacillus sp. SA1-12]
MKMMIDAGHGYETPGKRSVDGMREYEFNRAVAEEMKDQLALYEGVSVLYSHSDRRDVPLSERTAKANREHVNLFVSIHANAHWNGREWTSAAGIETYVYLSKPRTAYQLAKNVQACLVKHTYRKDRGVKTANFHVLKETKMTAILVECGFMTNKTEASLLRSAAYRLTCARAIVTGIVTTYNLKKKTIDPSDKVLYKVQTGAFAEKENALQLAVELEKKGYDAMIVSAKRN